MGAATAAVPVEADDEYALVAAGSPSATVARRVKGRLRPSEWN